MKRIIIILCFLSIAIFLFHQAPEYELVQQYQDGDIRVILNDTEITRNIAKLPQVAMLADEEVMLSQDTVDILFDKNLWYEEKQNTFITTTFSHRADLKVGERTITVDDVTKNIAIPPIKEHYDYTKDNRYTEKKTAKEIVYFPISALEEVYDITVEFKDKVIITENQKDRVRVTLNPDETIELKHTKSSVSKNVESVTYPGYIDIFDETVEQLTNLAQKEGENFVMARSSSGEIGYVKVSSLLSYQMVQETEKPEGEPQNRKPIYLAWDYIGPNATTIERQTSREKYEGLEVIAPTLLYLKTINGKVTGNLKYNENVVNTYLKWANTYNYRVWPTIKNDDVNIEATSVFLNDMVMRKKVIDEIIKFAKFYKVEGVNIDFEWIYEKDAGALSQFVRELCVKAKRSDILVSVCVNIPDGSSNWSLCYQHSALAEYADYIALMAYDQYGSSSKVAGPNASLDWVISNLEKVINREKVNSQKVLLGIPFYSRRWTMKNGKLVGEVLNMSKVEEYFSNSPGPIWQEKAGQYYYESADGKTKLWLEEKKSIQEKLKLIEKYQLGGVAFWSLGQENVGVWAEIDLIRKKSS